MGIKRKLSSIFYIPKFRLERPKVKKPPKPSIRFIQFLSFGMIFFVLSGGIYVLVNIGNPSLVPFGTTQSGEFTFIAKGINYQLALEGFIAGFFLFLGFLGSIIMYEGIKIAKNVYRSSYAEKLLFVGALMIIISFVFLQIMISAKVG
ncbi:MAG: hypothetical protein J7L50_01685 [Candidatus Odinarchaeota archaeon]|nr:hypothetical protein [Candidatus Odinarchaeota archaeon]